MKARRPLPVTRKRALIHNYVHREPRKFFREVRQEVGKVVWPTRKETMASTSMVLVLVFISAIFFWFVDSMISAGVRAILGLGA